MGDRSLVALQAFLAIHFFWFCKFIIVYKNFQDAAFNKIDNQLYNDRFVIYKNLPAKKKSLI